MQFIADFHIHSRHSMATSKQSDPDNLCAAAVAKGYSSSEPAISRTRHGVRTQESLVEDGRGLLRLRDQRVAGLPADMPSLIPIGQVCSLGRDKQHIQARGEDRKVQLSYGALLRRCRQDIRHSTR